jgi:hypothetical protein
MYIILLLVGCCLESYFWYTARPINRLIYKTEVSYASGYMLWLAPKRNTTFKLLPPILPDCSDQHYWIRHDAPLLGQNAYTVARTVAKFN